MARAVIIIRRWTRVENILSLRVDEVFSHIPRAVQHRFMAEIELVTYGTLHAILPLGRKSLYQKANSSSVPVYRVKVVEAAVLLGGTLALRKEEEGVLRICNNSPLNKWSTIEEPLEGPDDFTQQRVDRAVAGKSICVLGQRGHSKV